MLRNQIYIRDSFAIHLTNIQLTKGDDGMNGTNKVLLNEAIPPSTVAPHGAPKGKRDSTAQHSRQNCLTQQETSL